MHIFHHKDDDANGFCEIVNNKDADANVYSKTQLITVACSLVDYKFVFLDDHDKYYFIDNNETNKEERRMEYTDTKTKENVGFFE